jgi:hypothetical protein
MINTNNAQQYSNYGADNSSPTEGKKTENKQDNNLENQTNNNPNANANTNTSNPYQEPDNANITPENAKTSDHPVTVVDFDNEKSGVAGLYNKKEYTPEEAEIADFIAKVKDDTFAAILKSFDQMLANARKMMEENQRILREKVIPREEAMKAELAKAEIQQEILGQKDVLGLTIPRPVV